MKGAFCIARDTTAWLSQHLGDMENIATGGGRIGWC